MIVMTAVALLGITGAAGRETLVVDHEFSQQDHGWVPGFSDYGLIQESGMNLQSAHRPRPDDPARKALYLAGSNAFELVARTNAGLPPFWLRTDATGSAWLLVGTDSGYEGRTELYHTRIRFVFTPLALRIAKAGAGMVLTWDHGLIEESGDLKTWTPAPEATSPWPVMPPAGREFWRLSMELP